MNGDLEKYVKAGKMPLDFAQRLDKFSPGHYLLHSRLGVGKVKAWSLAAQKIQIDFEKEANFTMGLKLAFNQLTIIPDGHFLITCYDNAEECKQRAEDKKEMLSFIRLVLSTNFSLREGADKEILPMLPEDLERFLSGRVIEASNWKTWWDRARTAMRDDPGYRLPTKRGEAIALRKAASAAEALLDDYMDAKTLATCVRILDLVRLDILTGEYEIVAKLLKAMVEDIEKDRSEPQHVLELIIIRDDIYNFIASSEEKKSLLDEALSAEGVTEFIALADKLKTVSSEDLVTYVGELSVPRQRLVYEALPQALGDNWLAYTTNIFLFGGSKTTVPVADFIIAKGEKEQLFADLLNGLSRQSLSADVLIWICREREGLAKELVDKSKMILGSAILNTIERDSLEGGPNRALRLRNLLIDDKSLAPDLIRDLSEHEARPFAKGLYDSSVLADLDRNLLLANMMKVHAGLQSVVLSRTKVKEKQTMYVSLRSFEARKAEYEDLINVRIPKNKHDLEITRAEGDLRENGGYQDAKATRQVLMRRSEELSRLMALAEATDFSDADTSRTCMGTAVTLRSEKGEEVVFTILGAWDSDPDKNIIPYSSRQGQKLCGLSVGDSLRFALVSGATPVKATVTAIEPANKEYIYPDAQ